jgi:hypothetical protein
MGFRGANRLVAALVIFGLALIVLFCILVLSSADPAAAAPASSGTTSASRQTA